MKHPSFHPVSLRVAIAAAGSALLTAAAFAADSVPSPSLRDLHEAQCVAALEVQTEALAQQVKSGDDAQRTLLLDRLIAGTAFVGDAYLNSKLGQTQARQLAQDALQAQKSLPPAELAARQAACAAEGSKLYAAGNGLQKAVVQRLATKRMGRLLGD